MNPPSYATLTNIGAGYAPMATGRTPSRPMPTEGIPGFGGGGFGTIASVAAMPMIAREFGQVGMVPMGVGHDQNVYDRMMAQRFNHMQMAAMQQAAQSDRASYIDTFRGLAAITGTPFGHEQRRLAQGLASNVAAASPLLAQIMPEVLDQMGGLRGSATVMAARMIDAGRYRLDPVTGQMGMSADTVGRMTQNLHQDMFSRRNLPNMLGITAGQAGAMFHELQLRGMVGSAAAEAGYGGFRGDDPRSQTFRAVSELRRDSPDTYNRMLSRAGIEQGGAIGGSELDKLRLDPNVADRMRSFDSERVKRSLQSYTKAVAAMRDIFGDLGKQNAPMNELMAGLEAMTSGSMAQIDPSRISMMVRQTYNLAKQTGVPLENMFALQQHAAIRGQQLGLEPIFATHAAQGALAFRGAYAAQGMGAYTSWGAFNTDQATQLDANLRQQAAGSNMANRMAVAMRLSEQVGGYAEGSDAGRYVQSVRLGMNQFEDSQGRMRSMILSDREFSRMFTAQGVREGDIRDLLSQRDTNREYVERYGIQNTVRRSQGEELQRFVGTRMNETLTSRLRDQLMEGGMGRDEAQRRAREASTSVSGTVTGRIFDMSRQEMADTNTRNQTIAGFLEEELQGKGVLDGMDEGQRRRFLASTADRFYGATSRALKGSQYAAFGTLDNIHRLNNRVTLDEADRQQMQARQTAEIQEAMAPLGKGSILSRAVDALQNQRPGDPNGAATVIAQALGGVRTDDINKALVPQIEKLQNRRDALMKMQSELSSIKDPKQRAEQSERIRVALGQLSSETIKLAKAGEQYGMFAEAGLSPEDINRAGRSAGQSAETRMSMLQGQQAGVDKLYEISDSDRAEYVAKAGGPSDTQVTLHRDKNMKGSSLEESRRDLLNRGIMGARRAIRRSQFTGFFGSEEGQEVRQRFEYANQDAEEIADRLVRSPQAVQRYGTRALDMASTLNTGQQRLRELAMQYTGGDVSRLMAGDFVAKDAKDHKRITDEVTSVQKAQGVILNELHSTEGKPGRHFRADNEEEARRLLGFVNKKSLTADEQKKLEQMTFDVKVAQRTTPDQIDQYNRLEKDRLRRIGKGDDAGAAKAAEKIAELEKEVGVGSGGLAGAAEVNKRLREIQRRESAKMELPATDSVRSIFKEFGFDVGAAPSTIEQQIGGLLVGSRGHALASRVLDSTRSLKSRAARGGGQGLEGVDSMAEAYRAASKAGGSAITDFQKKYGFDIGTTGGAEEYAQFEKDVQLHQQMGLFGFGRNKSTTRRRNAERDLMDIMNQGMRGGQLEKPDEPKSMSPQHITGRLDVFLKGDSGQADLTGAWGGSVRTPPGGK